MPISLVNVLPKELTAELMQYCEGFLFILYKTDLFPVPNNLLTCSSIKFETWAHLTEWS